MSGALIYSKFEAKRNDFSVNKYKECLDVKLVFEEELNVNEDFDFVINRTNNYKIAQAFEKKHIRVFNNSFVSKIANDKEVAYNFLSEKGVPILPINYCGLPRVIKPKNAKGGFGVELITEEKSTPKDYISQMPASESGKDLRVYVIGDEIKFAALRENKDGFLSNFCLGGKAREYKLSKQEKELVNMVIDCFKFDFVGIDFLFHQGNLVFNEIEDSVGARMVYELSKFDIISEYCAYIKNELQ